MRRVQWLRSTLAILLAIAVGVLDHQAFRWIPPLEPLYYDGVGHALLLLITGLVAGLLLRSWWSLLIVPLAYTAGFEAAILVVSGTVGAPVDIQHLLWLLITASAPAAPLIAGAAMASAGWWYWRHWRHSHYPPTQGEEGRLRREMP